MARHEMEQRQVILKSILGRDADSRNIEISDLTPTTISGGITRDHLIELARQNPTAVKMAEADDSKSEISLKLEQENYIPDFDFGYTYQKTGPGFRDYYMLSVGAKIPLYFWRKQKPAVEQAALERESAKEQLRTAANCPLLALNYNSHIRKAHQCSGSQFLVRHLLRETLPSYTP